MRKFVGSYLTLALLAFGSLPSTPAHAANNTISFLSGSAPSGNPCTFVAPCLLMSEALANTAPGGEIICLDEGIFSESLTISRSVTIDCTTRRARLGGYNINAAGITVIIRGGAYFGFGIPALTYTAGNALIVEDCVMETVTTGISVTTSSFSNLIVNDCTISNYGGTGQAGIHVKPGAGTQANFTINRTVIENVGQTGGIGIFADGSAGGTSVGVVRDTFVSANPQDGIHVSGGTNTSVAIDNSSVVSNGTGVVADGSIGSVTVSLDHARVSGNGGIGVVSQNGAAVILNNSSVQANQTGLSATSGGGIFSYGNNPINGNQPGGIGTAPVVIALH
jgi:hypothetical protein